MAALVVLLAGATTVSAQFGSQYASPWSYSQASPPVQITVNANMRYQTMTGGGCSGAFGVACDQTGGGLSPATQQEISDYLFSENLGGLSILRNRIGSGTNDGYLASCPSSPSATFNYTFGTNNATADSCQLRLSQQALISNPNLQIYADAWSANYCFKSNHVDIDGGFICGVRGSNCTTDWRQGYADYLVQYVRFYNERGINITWLGGYNEPDFNPVTYASMESDGYQAKDFLEVLYPTVKKYNPDIQVTCCDATGARQARDIFYEVSQAGGDAFYDMGTWHNYQSSPRGPFNTGAGQPNMMTEWSDGSGGWNTTWDVTGQMAEGFQWALYIHDALVNAGTSGYLHWWCSQSNSGDAVLIDIQGAGFAVSRRLWAFAGFFRFARPGSVRIDAQSTSETMYASAFQNTNGTVAIPVINEARFAREVEVSLSGCRVNASTVTAYLADNYHNNTAMGTSQLNGTGFSYSIPPRAMMTFFLQ